MSDFDNLTQAERQFFNTEFVAPVCDNTVHVEIANVLTKFKVNYNGWAILKPINYRSAFFVRVPSLSEKQSYLSNCAKLSFVIIDQDNCEGILAVDDGRYDIIGSVPIKLPENAQVLDVVDCYFDGHNIWYGFHNTSHSIHSIQLREALNNNQKKLDIKGISARIQKAYQICLFKKIEKTKKTTQEKLGDYVKNAGGRLLGYTENIHEFIVEFSVGGNSHRSVINKNLRVISAGICLEYRDRDFDLQSLVSVVKEGEDNDVIYRVGMNK